MVLTAKSDVRLIHSLDILLVSSKYWGASKLGTIIQTMQLVEMESMRLVEFETPRPKDELDMERGVLQSDSHFVL